MPVVPLDEQAAILRDYGPKVEEIARVLERAGVALIVCTGAINIGDREPNRSVLADARHEVRLRELLERAEARLAKGEREGALEDFRAALELEPHFAWTHKRAGDVLKSLGRMDEARVEYQAAVDYDGASISFTSPMNRTLRDVTRKLGLPLVDLEASFQSAARDRMPGYDLFWDNCHPTLEGFLLMASGIAEAIEQRFHVERSVKAPTRAAVEAAFHIDPAFMADVFIGRGSNMYGLALLTWNPKERLARAHLYLDRCAELAPDNPKLMCTQAVLSLVEGDLATSRRWWQAAFAVDPEMARRRLAFPDIVQLLKTAGVDDPQSVFAR